MKLSTIEKILIVATLILGGMFLVGKLTKKSPAIGKTPEILKSQDLEISLEDFQIRYNKNALERNLPQMQLKGIEFGKTDRNTFGYKFVDTFYLLGKINPETGKIKSLSVTKQIVLNDNNELKISALAFLIMIQTLQPSLSAAERSAIIEKFSSDSQPYSKFVAGNIEYSMAILQDKKILVFSADPKKINPRTKAGTKK